ncbi:MAG: DUF2344 domain-containing protein [Firmicutes bacterium]|nr:DUF2344 domain-containing protein [Bacillota bacterium]
MRMILEFTREARVKYISHLDLVRAMQRTMRRGKIPIAFSQGFNPHPKLAFASALPVGVTSSSEFMDIILSQPMEISELIRRFNVALPKGISVKDAVSIDDSIPSLMSLIERADYRVCVDISGLDYQQGINNFLQQSEIIIEKQGKKGPSTVNLREGIFDISIGNGDNQELFLSLRSGSIGNIRPETVATELLKSMGVENAVDIPMIIHRVGLYMEQDGKWVTPLALKRR